MSAYMVGHYHINALVNWARGQRIRFSFDPADGLPALDATVDMDTIGDLLQRANEESVNARYKLDDLGPPYRYRPDPKAADLPALVILKACACLDYQSCEFDGWEQSAANKILSRIRDRAIHALPGYDDARGWSLTDD